MSVVSVEARSFILALFIRDDGERFLLGDNGYDFIDSQLHFTANAIENDEVQKQGTDGVLVAGQVRRASVQTFDGYIGDATIPKAKIEQMRRDFFAFFAKGHHFRVIYVDCNRDAWQRKGGYLVDAPEVKELWQIHPEYHVGLNFEDVNYYEYDENAEGEEILANVLSVPISSEIEGGLEWDENGAISVLPYGDSKTATGKTISISDAVNAPLASFQLDGETSQTGTPTPDVPVPVQTVTGENVVKICGKNLYDYTDAAYPVSKNGLVATLNSDGSITVTGTPNANYVIFVSQNITDMLEDGATYTVSSDSYSADFYIDVVATRIGGGISYPANTRSGSASFTVNKSTFSKYTINIQTYTTTSWGASSKTITRKFQLEAGSAATDFKPYQEQSYPISLGSIELCKIGTYQDYIYKSGDKWYVRKEIGKVAVDSSYYSTRYGTNSYGLTQFLINLSFENYFDSANIANMLSNSFDKQSTSFANTQVQGFLPALDPSLHRLRAWVRINTTTADTEAQFKTWLDNNRPIFYYKLDTPTDTEITNEALVAQLEAILSQGHTYAGTTNITTVIATGNEQGTLEVGYYSGYQDGGYVWEEGGSGGPTTVVNESISAVYPVWTVYGPAQNPILENTTNNTSIEYVGMVADGQTLVIDMGAQTASLDGLNVLSALTGDFIQLEAGSNILLYSASNDAPASEIGWSEIVG